MNAQPIKLLIAALGGEGGGVLAGWLVEAATRAGFPVQSTSVPGVAQRTGATTYYIEIFPAKTAELGGRMPVLALAPGPGDVDLLIASELMEAGRAVLNGYPSSDRTLVIASTHRAYLVVEKMAMADGRYDPERLREAVVQNARAHRLFDMAALAKKSGAMINAVMLGAIAGSGALPISASLFEDAIRVDGKAVEANLRGFRAGLEAMTSAAAVAANTAAARDAERSISRQIEAFPERARTFVGEGVRRLTEYQDAAYADLYLSRLRRIAAADEAAGASGEIVRETARHLALRMSYEDVIRVAQAKSDPQRIRRIAAEVGADDNPFTVAEFFSPGLDEFCSILPAWLARPLIDFAERRGLKQRLHFSMRVKTTSLSGYARLRALAALRPLRPRTYRYGREQAAIEAWLDAVVAAAKIAPALALEIVECARLIKGYGDTHERGSRNYAAIEARVIAPTLAGVLPLHRALDAIASARAAALADPEGDALARTLDAIEAPVPMLVAAE